MSSGGVQAVIDCKSITHRPLNAKAGTPVIYVHTKDEYHVVFCSDQIIAFKYYLAKEGFSNFFEVQTITGSYRVSHVYDEIIQNPTFKYLCSKYGIEIKK